MSVLIIRALLFTICIRASVFWKLPVGCAVELVSPHSIPSNPYPMPHDLATSIEHIQVYTCMRYSIWGPSTTSQLEYAFCAKAVLYRLYAVSSTHGLDSILYCALLGCPGSSFGLAHLENFILGPTSVTPFPLGRLFSPGLLNGPT